jgi:hypothetical protein
MKFRTKYLVTSTLLFFNIPPTKNDITDVQAMRQVFGASGYQTTCRYNFLLRLADKDGLKNPTDSPILSGFDQPSCSPLFITQAIMDNVFTSTQDEYPSLEYHVPSTIDEDYLIT